jgi:hypothetical protein
MRALDGFARRFGRFDLHRHVDASYYKHPFVCLHFSGDFRGKLSVTGINPTRFQRASECAEHSAGSCSDDVVDRRGVRFGKFSGIDFVVRGYGSMDAEDHGLRFTR